MADLDPQTRVTAHLTDTITVGGTVIRHLDECRALIQLDGEYIAIDTTQLEADQPKAEAV